MSKLKIAVVGATGFIGRHVVTELLKYDVDIVATYYSSKSKLISPSKVHWLNFDIGKSSDNIFSELGKPDVLIHLTWSGLPNYNSPHHYETELPNQYDFLRKMILGGLKSVVIAGTCFEYGMQSGLLSSDLITTPNNPYGYAKDALRKQLEFLKSDSKFNFTWARLFYMYGEGQSSASLYTKLKEAVARGDKVFNMSGGEQLRDFLDVEEVAQQLVQLALTQRDMGCVNVSSGYPISVRKLVEQWLNKNDWNIDLNLGYYPYPDYEPMAFWGDNPTLDTLQK